MEKAAYKRKTYFIDKSFQAKFILKFCLLVAMGGLLTIGILYLLAARSNTVSFVNSRVVVRSTADFILPVLVQTVVVVLIIVSAGTVAVTMFVSHKIAGPLYRFKKAMQELGEGNFSGGFHIRDADQLKDLAATFHVMIKRTQEAIKGIKASTAGLKDRIKDLSDEVSTERRSKALAELKKISEELDKTLDHFTV